jgi:precorrin-6A synthase
MRKLSIVGIGAGDPEHVTVQAINALNRVNVVFVVTKASEQQELVDLRTEILARYVEDASYRTVEIADPERERGAPTEAYRAAVEDWRARRAERYERAIRDELGEDERGAFLAWGDPALYDSTLGVLDAVRARRTVAFELDVVPGISSVSALAARHQVVLNRVGGAVQVTTGRRLRDGFPTEADDVVVMLDAACAFRDLAADDVDIYWGAYVGTRDEILVSGPLAEVADEIVRVRAEAKARKGWMFDTYLLRRRGDRDEQE